MSRHFAIAFPKTREGLSKDIAFQGATLSATEESLKLLMVAPNKLSVAPLVEVRTYPNTTTAVPIEEYDQYSKVYFLNDAAMQMCKELGLSLPIIAEVEGVPDEYGYQVRGHYLPHAGR